MFHLFFDYSFLTVLLGTCFFALASSTLGTICLLTKQSLIGDALGHASYPGIILAFMIFKTRHPFLLLLGAIFSGYLSYGLIYLSLKYSKSNFLNHLALISSSLFGLGILLKQFMQGNKHFSNVSQYGLDNYLFGQAAFIQKQDVYLIVIITCLSLFCFYSGYHFFKIYLFDHQFADLVGISNKIMRQIIILLMVCLIAVGLKLVGAILISSFLIIPSSLGLMLGRQYHHALMIANACAIGSTCLGVYLSSTVKGLSTGPTIIIIMSVIVLIAFIYTTYWSRGDRHV